MYSSGRWVKEEPLKFHRAILIKTYTVPGTPHLWLFELCNVDVLVILVREFKSHFGLIALFRNI